jgi:hypothetical protein
MAKFTFSLPNGQLFTLNGPADATVAQAEQIFLEQLASGSFVGLFPGDVLQSLTTTSLQFELSRLDRGTAGVPTVPLIAIYAGNTVAGIITSGVTILSSLPSLTDVPVSNGITTADYLAQTTVTDSVGPLTASQVQAIIAAVAAFVCQEPNIITNELGLGRYGLSAQQLEQTGYVKPGTSARFITDPTEFVTVLSSPTVWTGIDGVTSVDNLLINTALQDRIQLGLIHSSYATLIETGEIVAPAGPISTTASSNIGLLGSLGITSATAALTAFKNAGGISGLQATATNLINTGISNVNNTITTLTNLPGTVSNLVNGGIADLGGLLATASKFGVDNALAWAKGNIPGVSGLLGQIQQMAKLGQFAVNFNDFKLPAAVAGIAPAIGYAGTVNRATLNAATAKLIGSDKIPLPNFAPEAISSGALTALAKQARSLLGGSISGVTNQIGGAISSARSIVSSARSVVSTISSFFG